MQPRSKNSVEIEAEREFLSDEEVVARTRSGDTAVFELLMRRHNQLIFRALRAILKDDAEAEDVLQECYVRAYEKLHTFRGEARVSSWMTRIGVNLALDRLRKRGRTVSLEPSSIEVSNTGTPEDASATRELNRLLESAIDALPAPYRSVFVLREVEGLGTQDTADSLGIESATVKTRLHRARAHLRKDLYARVGVTAPEVFRFGGERCDRVVASVLAKLSANRR